MTMPRVLTETAISLSAVAQRLAVSHAAVRRWVAKGVKVDGRFVRLEAAKPGGSWRTSVEAVERFVEATSPASEPTVPERTPAQRRRDSEKACRELEAAGW